MNDLQNSILIASSILLLGIILTLIVARICKSIFSKLAAKTKSETDDYILSQVIRFIKPFGIILSASLSLSSLPLPNLFYLFTLGISKLLILLLIIRLLNKSILRIIQRWALKIEDKSVASMLRSLSPLVRSIIWCLGIILYLQNIGVQMAAIWALLSAGGIGAGLALKEPVQEFFEYITILLDKPFENGQFINAGGVWATVERVGVRSTRLKSLNGEIIVMSNSSLTNGIISNYAEMKNRRLVHRLGVVYDTPVQTMKNIPEVIESIVKATDDVIFDRCHFVEFGNFSLEFELVYYIPNNNYKKAMAAQEKINLAIMIYFEKEGIEFAFPTQTININNLSKNIDANN